MQNLDIILRKPCQTISAATVHMH